MTFECYHAGIHTHYSPNEKQNEYVSTLFSNWGRLGNLKIKLNERNRFWDNISKLSPWIVGKKVCKSEILVDLVNHLKGYRIAVFDNNRTNQALFKEFDTDANKPLVTKNVLYLLFDYVHIFKSIHNNWITEDCSELLFYSDDKEMTAKWEIVK